MNGDTEPGFRLFVDVFGDTLDMTRDGGAAVAVYLDGRKVVDLWGGVADVRSGRAWTADTPAVVFSCTKGMLTICAYLLVQDGRLDLDAPATDYWPAFGQGGKDGIPVRWLLSHRAGVPALDQMLSLEDVIAWEPVIRAIEVQTPMWTPGAAHSYHPLTFGWLVGEVIRRITGKTPGTFFREAVADPLRLDTWIGLPPSWRGSVAWVEPPLATGELGPDPVPANDPVARTAERSLSLGGALPFPTDRGVVTYNDPRVQAAEIPGANGITTARSLARLYSACSSANPGTRLLARSSIDDATWVRSEGAPVLGFPDASIRWGTGFMLDSPPGRPMLGARSFGHDGAGGQFAFGDDAFRVGFAYVTNQMGGPDDDRATRLAAALRTCLGADRLV
jgi:CubicO group peptidase (beta-lactamase class C family)